MNRRSFLSSFLIAPTVIKRMLKPKPKGLFFAEFKYYIIDRPGLYDDIIFHQREHHPHPR